MVDGRDPEIIPPRAAAPEHPGGARTAPELPPASPPLAPQVASPPPAAGVEVIEVKLRSLHQLFHSLDPSPFYERDLDEAAERFIVGWVKDFPTGRPYHLRVHVVEPPPFDTDELGVSVRRYFAERARQERRELRGLFRRGRLSLAIGIAFLLLCTVVAELSSRWSEAGFVPRVLEEGLTIAGWVALWRPIQIFLYDWWPIRAEQRLFERLSRIEVDLVVDAG